MNRIEDIKNHPMLKDIKNNLKMRGIFISETKPYSYEDEIKMLEERKTEPQEFLDYLIENDVFNQEVKRIELAEKAIENATISDSFDDEAMETLTDYLDSETRNHNTTIRMKTRSEVVITAAEKEIQRLREEKFNALGVSDEDILDFLSEFR